MLTHRGFSAWIQNLDGQEAYPEYLAATDEVEHRVSCWIPCREGEPFSVFWRDHGGKVDTCSFITVDGTVVPGRFLFGSGLTSRQGVRVGQDHERPFKFSKIDNSGPQQDVQKDVGAVILRIKRIQRLGGQPADRLSEHLPAPINNRQVGDMCVTFGDAAPTTRRYEETWRVKPHVTDHPDLTVPTTFVTFIFRYRSPEFLKMQGIMNDVKVPPSYTAIKRGLSEPPANEEEVEEEEPESSPLTSLPCSSPPERSPLPVPMYVPRPRNASNSNSLRSLGRGKPPPRGKPRASVGSRRVASWRTLSNGSSKLDRYDPDSLEDHEDSPELDENHRRDRH